MADHASIQRVIEIDGSELAADIDAMLENAVVRDRLTMPDMFALVLRDPDRDILGRAGIKVGTKVKISTTSKSEDGPKPLFDGEVTSIETEYDARGTRAVVRGYDLSHRLVAGRKTATFLNVKYSDIASQIASAAGLTPDVDESEGTYDHVFQTNQSDLDFLRGLAARIGFDFRVDGETMLFKKPVQSSTGPAEGDASTEAPTQLVWGQNLLDFRGRMSAVAQVSEVEVRGWDPKEKKEIVASAETTATHADLPMKPPDLAGKVGGQKLVVVNHGVDTHQAAEQTAKALGEQVGSAAYEATAIAVGSPDLRAGTAVSVAGVEGSLAGKWVISGTQHDLGSGSYRTTLEFTGRQDRSIHGLLAQGAGAVDRIPGVVTAVVTDNVEPAKMGRVRLSYAWMASDAESYWARVAGPGAGKDYGVVWIPQVGDEVLVAFEFGDISRPLVLGGLWNGKDTIPFDYEGDLDAGSVTYCGFTSRTGHKISFFESQNESKIQLLTAGGAISIVLDGQNKELKIETTGKVTIDAQQDIQIKTQGSFKVEAMGVEIKASGQTAIKGATVALN
jgi:phage protein D